MHVTVGLTAGRQLSAQVWVAQVGRVPLLLLDSYVEENEADLHEVTDRLYGGGSDHRLRQELLLGIGGVRAVRAFCALRGYPSPEVFHTNEGHAGFLGLERIREYVEQGLSFDEAIEVCRAGTVFTTHTPVPAGIDRFERSLIREHFADDPLLPIDRVLALGAETYPGGDPDVFNMAVMGMRLAQRVNGVSLLHGQVSREMFAGPVAGLRHPRGAHRLDHQRRAHPHLGGAGDLAGCWRPGTTAAPQARRGERLGLGPGRGRPGRRAVGGQARAARPAGGRDPAPAARLLAAARRVRRPS